MQAREPNLAPEEFGSLIGVPLSVIFADNEELRRVRNLGEAEIKLTPPFHLSHYDGYFVLPDDIGMEIIDIFADADDELLAESLRDGLVALGTVEPRTKGSMVLEATHIQSGQALLKSNHQAASTIYYGNGTQTLEQIRALKHLQCTLISSLFDDDGLEQALREEAYLGVSWRVPASLGSNIQVDPTYIFTRQFGESHVNIELALFVEDEELILFFRPLSLVPST
jgi:hypothetical protein